MVKIKGKIERILFSKNGFAIVKLSPTSESVDALPNEIKNQIWGELSMTGMLGEVFPDMLVEAEGKFTTHPKYGFQFEAESCQVSVAKTAEGVIRYLSMSGFAGIGPEKAKAIVKMFGENVIEEIIEKEPERLSEVKGISKERALAIAKAHGENSVYRELYNLKLTQRQITKLYEEYGKKAAKVIKDTPYKCIYDINGFGFKIVDRIARDNGTAENAPERIAAALTFILTNIGEQGHCWTTQDGMFEAAKELLPEPTVTMDLITDAMVNEIANNHIIREADGHLYAKALFDAENNTAKNLVNLVHKPPITKISQKVIENAISETEIENGFELGAKQKLAVTSALTNRVSVITGGPGTGKTTIVKAIIKGWMYDKPASAKTEDYILMCAPTGKAARRMSEVTSVHAETIQRIILRQEKTGDKEFDKLIILDEASMADIYLADKLVSLASQNNQIVLIGDIDQLPPIGPGNFFRDCVTSPIIPTVQLDLSHRQTGFIAINAKRINEGMGTNALKLDDPSFVMVNAEKEQACDRVVEQYMGLLNSGYSVSDICCIVPIRKAGRSHTSADDLNNILRERVNPERPGMSYINDVKFRVGDRVMNTENDYDREIFNGDCGIVKEIDPENNIVILEMDDGRLVDCSIAQTANLTLAYAITVHKSQGSEYKAIVVAQNKEHYYMLQRNLLYTAVTRAKEKVIIVGERAAINMAVKKIPAMERNTSLKSKIKTYMLKEMHRS